MDANGFPIEPTILTKAIPSISSKTAPSLISLETAPSTSDLNVDDQDPLSAIGKQDRQQMAAAASAALEAQVAAQLSPAELKNELCKSFSVGIQNENNGSFTSPGYPNPYPVNLKCTKLIEAPPGHYIVLEFRDLFEVEPSQDCESDSLTIRDGSLGLSQILAKYCGLKFPPEVRSSGEAMWVNFRSDTSVSMGGFKAVYRFERQKDIKPAPPHDCRFNVTAPKPIAGNSTAFKSMIHSGVIKNNDIPDALLNYTKDYNVTLQCIWNIAVMPGWKIYLTFSNYELSKPNDCDSNFISIYEEHLLEENQTVKFCGTRTEPQTSKSNVFNIIHQAKPSAGSSKFEIVYTAFREKNQNGVCDPDSEFDCDDGTCIHESLKCNGLVNCKYRYDENSDPGPCKGSDADSSFFETEHMVIILIVFLTLVSGMCASIVISCWGKIQERRRRKLDYHMRKSRDASTEGNLNEVDQLVNGSSKDPTDLNNKQRLAGSVSLAENHVNTIPRSVQEAILAANSGQRLLKGPLGLDSAQQQQSFISGVQYQPHPLLGYMMPTDKGTGNYVGYAGQRLESQGSAIASNSSLDTKTNGFRDEKQYSFYGSRGKIHDSSADLRKSTHNSQQSLISSAAGAQSKGQNQFGLAKQQPVPHICYSNQMKLQSGASLNNQILSPISNMNMAHDAQHQQQLLNFSLNPNQLARQQHSLIYNSNYSHQRQIQHDNETNTIDSNNLNINPEGNCTNNNSANSNIPNNPNLIQTGANSETSLTGNDIPINQRMSRYLAQQQSLNRTPVVIADHQNPVQTMPLSMAIYNNIVQGRLNHQTRNMSRIDPIHQLDYDAIAAGPIGRSSTYNPARAFTVSSMHHPLLNNQQQAVYGVNINRVGQPLESSNLSSSMTCCNVVNDMSQETPLLNNLLVRANQQHPSDDYELKSLTMVPRFSHIEGNIPRSLSAYQLSRTHARQPQDQTQQIYMQLQQMQQQRQQDQQQRAQQQLQFKSMSDAGRGSRHQPPNHSLSYPHACTGAHLTDQPGPSGMSPAIPPPPPPPSLAQMRSTTSSGTVPIGNSQMEGRRAAFKMSRLYPSQLTNDSLQEQDLNMAPAKMVPGSMQMDDTSTESDATFCLLMNSLG